MERTLVLVKPDAVQRGLIGEVLLRLERTGLKIIALKMLRMDRDMAGQHYGIHQGKAFFEGLVQFITSGPLVAAVLEGPGAVEVVRKEMGETDPVKALPGSIRGDLALSIGRNIVHGSDSSENARKEISLFFKHGEILDYERQIDGWIRES
ncbi:MAG: nucleoside-diphosphate kinase [Dehalococcoidia bacterium]|nr:nucleoside-diphosphate kinase [Dehalococcoidia bacterium]